MKTNPFLSFILLAGFIVMTISPAYPQSGIAQRDDLRNIIVKFRDDLRMTLGESGTPVDRTGKGLRSPSAASRLEEITTAGGSWIRMSGASEEETDRLRGNAEANLNREISNLNNYFILHVPDGKESGEWIDDLKALEDVEIALFTPLPTPLPVPGSFQARQGYLNGSSNGIDANYAWSLGDSGQNVTICDFEYSWNLSHQDLPAGITTLTVPTWTAVDPFTDNRHGTAVLGEMASINNGWGTTGAAYGAGIAVAPTNFATYGWQLGSAMTYAMTQLGPGDVMLIEHQIGGPMYLGLPGNDTGLIPIEWWKPWYDVVVTAVGNGFHVVEAGGNGYQNLDAAVYATGNGGHWPFLPQNNSGAIIVGAGAAPSSFYGTDTARSRLSFSNYGSRLDLQGWGEFVTTTGYGFLHNSEGVNLEYDSSFSGTSSASPIVASAVALAESRFESLYGSLMAPLTMRAILKNTGTAQKAGTHPLSENIGPLPNLNSALNFASSSLAGGTYQVGVSRTYTSLTHVSTELSTKILLGNVIFELMSDYISGVETYPIVYNQFTTAGGNWTVTIRPAAGVSSRVTSGSPPPYLPLIHLNGVDRITFDGRPGGMGSGDWVLRNARTDSTGPTFLFSAGADFNALTYLRIESQCSTTVTGTVLFGRPSDSTGNRKNAVAYNVIRDRSDMAGLPQVAVNSFTPAGVPNDSNDIVGNDIFGWTAFGLNLNGEHWKVDSNSFFQVIPQSTSLTAIQVNSGNGHLIRDNHIGGGVPLSGGPPLILNGNVPFTGIQLTAGTLVPTVVERNIIRNITLTSSGTASFWGITASTMGIFDIRNNAIGDTGMAGAIWLSGIGSAGPINIFNINGGAIEDNSIVNIRQSHTPAGEMRCISLNSSSIFSIKGNLIHSVGPSVTGAAGLVRGIYLDQVIDSVLIANNMISLGLGDSNDVYYSGIYDFVQGGAGRVDIAHNSVAIGGISTGSGASEALIHDAPSISFITLRNNIFHNVRTGGGGFHYAVVTLSPTWLPGPMTSDFNILFNLAPPNLAHWMGFNVDFPNWQIMSAGDLSSYNADPQFINPLTGDLHIDPTVYSPADNAGMVLLTVTDDFDGNVRGPSPDIGADEYTINSPGAFALLTPPNSSTGQPASGTLTWGPSAASGFYMLYFDTLTPPTTLLAGPFTDTSFAYGPVDSNRTYYWSVTANNSTAGVPASGSPWSFTVGTGSGAVSRSYAYDSSWNMLSVPLDVSDFSRTALYPLASSNAFVYNGGYQVRDTLEPGVGYWIKFGDTGTAAMTGYSPDPETVDVSTGWNIIGSIDDAVTVSSITSIPGGIVTSSFYGYAGGYSTADTIVPGKSYWVKTSQAGKIILTTDTTGMVPANRLRIEKIAERPPLPPPDGEIDETRGGTIPSEYAMEQNYPNPFNSTTAIRFHLPGKSRVSIRIHDILGREVATLLDRTEAAGSHVVFWRTGDVGQRELTTGVYYFRIRAVSTADPENAFTETRRALLLK